MRYVFHATITKVERKRRAVRAHKPVPPEPAVVEYEDLGWFVSIDPFAVSVSVGDAEPTWKPGQAITLILEERRGS
jgi:hypothetical protein